MAKRTVLRITAVVLAFAFLSLANLASDRGLATRAAAAGLQAQQGGKGMQGMPMQDMMKMHEKMMADMKAEQAKLDDLVKKMNSTTGDARVNVMAELLTEIVRGHRMMGDHMGNMHQHMMKMGK